MNLLCKKLVLLKPVKGVNIIVSLDNRIVLDPKEIVVEVNGEVSEHVYIIASCYDGKIYVDAFDVYRPDGEFNLSEKHEIEASEMDQIHTIKLKRRRPRPKPALPAALARLFARLQRRSRWKL